jgi:hypothetical protein
MVKDATTTWNKFKRNPLKFIGYRKGKGTTPGQFLIPRQPWVFLSYRYDDQYDTASFAPETLHSPANYRDWVEQLAFDLRTCGAR